MTALAPLGLFEVLVGAAIVTTAVCALVLLGMLVSDWARGKLW